jgi:hypothetical protein
MSDIPSRALRETLRDGLEAPVGEASSGCLEADTLAAWADGTLSRSDRATLESHAASCARCQAMLAVMVRTAPPLPARRWWKTSTVRWLVPIATVSAMAVAVWTRIPAQRQVASVRPSLIAPAVSTPVSEARPADVTAPSAKAIGALERPSERKRPEPPAAEVEKRSAPAGVDTFSTTQPAPSAPPASRSSADQKDEAAAPTAREQAPSAAPAPVESNLRLANPGRLAESVAIQPSQPILDRMSAAPVIVRSPNPSIRWRIMAGTSVERSTDRGITWQAQSTGAAVRLMAGAAPSPTTCWLVGVGGVVLVSHDGQTWQRVAFPEAIDLTAILATDGLNATVTAADGRAFRTTDGGKTWR